MDPLSITVSVSSLIVVCARIIKLSSNLSNTYRSAAFMLSAITSECNVISASLTRLQNMLSSQPDRLGALAESLETSLLGCALTMSVLQEQIGGLAEETENGELKPKKFKFVLEKDHLQELLQQIRGQQISITLLLQTYQSDSLNEVKQSVQDFNTILQQMVSRGISLWRETHSSAQNRIPTAIIGNSEADSVFELSSIISDTRFDFDDEILESRAYRRALGNLRQAQDQPNHMGDQVDETRVSHVGTYHSSNGGPDSTVSAAEVRPESLRAKDRHTVEERGQSEGECSPNQSFIPDERQGSGSVGEHMADGEDISEVQRYPNNVTFPHEPSSRADTTPPHHELRALEEEVMHLIDLSKIEQTSPIRQRVEALPEQGEVPMGQPMRQTSAHPLADSERESSSGAQPRGHSIGHSLHDLDSFVGTVGRPPSWAGKGATSNAPSLQVIKKYSDILLNVLRWTGAMQGTSATVDTGIDVNVITKWLANFLFGDIDPEGEGTSIPLFDGYATKSLGTIQMSFHLRCDPAWRREEFHVVENLGIHSALLSAELTRELRHLQRSCCT